MYSYADQVPSPSPSFSSISSKDPRRITDTELDSVFMAQHEHTLRARNLPRPPSTFTSAPSSPASASFWTSPEPRRPFRRLPEPPKPKMRRLPEPPMSSPSSITSFASTSSSVNSNATASSSSSSSSTSTETSYLTFDDDTDSDSDELSELSDSTWNFVEFQGKAFPLPRTSSLLSKPSGSPRRLSHSHSQLHGARSLPRPAVSRSRSRGASSHSHSHSHSPSPLQQQSQILREISAKELEPIGPVMEPAIFADDGAQGNWRELVDDFFMRE